MDGYIPPECLVAPPAIYDRAPDVAPIVTLVTQEQLRFAVERFGSEHKQVPGDWIICGVTVPPLRGLGNFNVYILQGMPQAATDAVMRHELAHVNGWEHG